MYIFYVKGQKGTNNFFFLISNTFFKHVFKKYIYIYVYVKKNKKLHIYIESLKYI